ncbi:Ecp21-1 [Fulvia fulva]|uniref:Ecp21-1 n=1 Tax=Passalora fulva TaxID=5499 RepID=A0A1P8YXI1_PASFU|nr:Ecp21-1 [Fulvia fulva]AQA29210.1 extracellular protein 21-1 [Fulvia fulva]KAK4617669.1 Ecp21-1 [Fulvia fulva]KAK4618421.1 Ecp21-1 [Fulvia fulva]UJO20599.1 Ecp21-1 [Fulvia fulva]WPV18294.1 Ecp21-1 [Fulvia fulva]
MLPTIFAATLALIAGTNAVAVAQGAAQPESELINGNRKVCAFDETLGPSLLVASVKVPSQESEINAWAYGINWCTSSNLVSKGKNFCTGRGVEYLHVPLTDKFGAQDDRDCYANFKVEFVGCPDEGNDYTNVTAKFTSTSDGSSFEYQCVSDRELHGCVYNGQLQPPSEASYTAFLTCGITAEP